MLRSRNLPSVGHWKNEIVPYVVLRSRDLSSVGHWTNEIAPYVVLRSRNLPSAGHWTNDIVPIVVLRSRDLPSVGRCTNEIAPYVVLWSRDLLSVVIRQTTFYVAVPVDTCIVALLFQSFSTSKSFTGLGFECGLYVKALKDSCISEDQNKLEIGDYVMKVR